MAMSKKDFEAFARIILSARDEISPGESQDATLLYIGREIAEVCGSSNPSFNRARFLEACGLPTWN